MERSCFFVTDFLYLEDVEGGKGMKMEEEQRIHLVKMKTTIARSVTQGR